MKAKSKRRWTASQTVILVILVILLVLSLLPIWIMLIKSVKSIEQGIYNPFGITFPFYWNNYSLAWLNVSPYILNSFIISIFTTIVTVVLCSLMAYGFTRYRFPGQNFLFMCVLALMMIPSVLTLLPQYELANQMGLINNPLGVILPLTAAGLPLGVMLLRTFYNGLPKDLFEAAELDGASSIYCFLQIALPLSLPITATLALTAWMTAWNDLIWSTLILRRDTVQTFSVALNGFTSDYYEKTHSFGVPLAGYVIVSLPLIIIFSFTSKQFVSGLTSGAFKM